MTFEQVSNDEQKQLPNLFKMRNFTYCRTIITAIAIQFLANGFYAFIIYFRCEIIIAEIRLIQTLRLTVSGPKELENYLSTFFLARSRNLRGNV